MIRYKVLYAILLVIMVLFFILYRGKLSQELLIFTVLFPIFPFLIVWRLRRSVQLSLEHSTRPVQKGEVFQWSMILKNKSIFSSAHGSAELIYSNSLDGSSQRLKVALPILPRNEQQIQLTFHATTCGVMKLRIEQLEIFDPIRLFRKKIPLELEDSIVIMPDPNIQLAADWAPQPRPDADAAEYAKDRPGDDPSEIYDLHSYRDGDPVSRIHWKLSSKLDSLMVKEYSMPLSSGCILLPDFRHCCAQPESARRLDAMLSALSAAAEQLCEKELPFRFAGYHPGTGIGLSDPVKEISDAAGWIRGMIDTAPLPSTEQNAFYECLREFLAGSRNYDKILLFSPRSSKELHTLLYALPDAEQILLFTVAAPAERIRLREQEDSFREIPVQLTLPVQPGEGGGRT